MIKYNTLRMCNLFKQEDHIFWGKGRVFPLLDSGFKQHYPFANVHCIKYVFKYVKKRNRNKDRQLLYYAVRCNL